jgi:hypothetical protein
MLTATVGWILLIQVVITIIIFLWSYDRYAKRWSTALGRYSVEGAYSRVDYIAGEGASYMVSYGYTVDGKRYFGAINRSIRSMSLLLSIEENVEKLQKEYLTGRTVKVFYFKESPAEHWLDVPPDQLLVFFKAIGIPLLILILSNVPLLFIDYLIISSPYS